MSSRQRSAAHFVISLVLPGVLLCANLPWTKDYAAWTTEDAQRVLEDSPWAQRASASFENTDIPEPAPAAPLPGPAQAGMAGSRGVSDGRWDGGIGRNNRGGVPSLSVIVRWDSAGPVRQALARMPGEPTYTVEQFQKDYIVTVIGLVPAGRYRGAGHLETQSRSGENNGVDPQDPEEMLEGLMSTSKLMPRGKAAIAAEDVKLDAASGAIHVFFPRTAPIDAADKEVLFATRFGSMTINKKFRLKDLAYKGRLDL